jgi:hypothetical protein
MHDRVAVVRLPLVSPPVPSFTTDRPVARDAIGRIAGRLAIEERAQDGITADSRHIGSDINEVRGSSGEPERPRPSAWAETPDGTSIVVRYARDARMGLWVPAEMKERYRTAARAGTELEAEAILLEGTARYSNLRRFQVTTEEKVVVPK